MGRVEMTAAEEIAVPCGDAQRLVESGPI